MADTTFHKGLQGSLKDPEFVFQTGLEHCTEPISPCRDAIAAYKKNLRFVESENCDGVGVKAKDGSLVIELPKTRKLSN